MAKKYKSTDTLLRRDPIYKHRLVAKFVNCLMHDGKKTTAQRVFYDAMDDLQKKFPDQEPLQVFLAAVNNLKPLVEVRSRRVGGATYQVPVEVGPKRQTSLALRWLLAAVRKKKGKPTSRKLVDELAAAYRKEGTAYTTRENVHRMAEANKAFAHFAW